MTTTETAFRKASNIEFPATFTPAPAPIETAGPKPAPDGPAAAEDDSPGGLIEHALRIARERLGMDVAFITEWSEGKQIFRHLAGDRDLFGIDRDQGLLLCDSYCERVAHGEMPSVIPDSSLDPVAAEVRSTKLLGIGSYVGAPIELSTGEIFGMLCCISRSPNPSLKEMDARFLEAMADLVAPQIERTKRNNDEREQRRNEVEYILDTDRMKVLLQPIVDLASGKVVGAEALSRFHTEPSRSPDRWFADAADVGLGRELELAAVRRAFEKLPELGAGRYLSVNVSPDTAISNDLEIMIRSIDGERLVIELTEHTLEKDTSELRERLAVLRSLGVRVAIDDAGAGYSGLSRILELQPHKIKLDMSLTRNIDTDRAKRALASSLVGFATEIGAMIVAEGIETPAELRTVRQIGIRRGQGYGLMRPTGGKIPHHIPVDGR